MIKLTKSDLYKKSDAQLSALFSKISLDIQIYDVRSNERRLGLAALELIAKERGRRAP